MKQIRVLRSYDIPESMFPKIADLDSEVFASDSDDFGGDTTMPKETIFGLLKKNISTTIVIVDENENPIAYYQVFPLEKQFQEKYINGKLGFKDLDDSKVLGSEEKEIDLYVWTIAIKKEYRGMKVQDPANPNETVAIMKLLQEGLVDCLSDLIKQGVKINNIYGEGVSEKGKALMEGFCGKEGLIHENKEDNFAMYGSKFNPECDAFNRCRNQNKLLQAIASKENEEGNKLSSKIDLLANDKHLKKLESAKQNLIR